MLTLVLLLSEVLLVHLGIEHSVIILSTYIPVVIGFEVAGVLKEVVWVTPPKIVKHNNATIIQIQ